MAGGEHCAGKGGTDGEHRTQSKTETQDQEAGEEKMRRGQGRACLVCEYCGSGVKCCRLGHRCICMSGRVSKSMWWRMS